MNGNPFVPDTFLNRFFLCIKNYILKPLIASFLSEFKVFNRDKDGSSCQNNETCVIYKWSSWLLHLCLFTERIEAVYFCRRRMSINLLLQSRCYSDSLDLLFSREFSMLSETEAETWLRSLNLSERGKIQLIFMYLQ